MLVCWIFGYITCGIYNLSFHPVWAFSWHFRVGYGGRQGGRGSTHTHTLPRYDHDSWHHSDAEHTHNICTVGTAVALFAINSLFLVASTGTVKQQTKGVWYLSVRWAVPPTKNTRYVSSVYILYSKSPRWACIGSCSSYPRMLLNIHTTNNRIRVDSSGVREFHVGRTFWYQILFSKINKKQKHSILTNCWERLSIATYRRCMHNKRNSMRVDEGRKSWRTLLAIKMKARAVRSGEERRGEKRREKRLPSDSGSDYVIRVYQRQYIRSIYDSSGEGQGEKKSCEYNNRWGEQKKKRCKVCPCPIINSSLASTACSEIRY